MYKKKELMEKIDSIKSLLTKISDINKKYEEIYRISGEKFNIFNILNLSSDELSHSKIIESLLNPKGTHGKGNKFLELFLKCLDKKEFSKDDKLTGNFINTNDFSIDGVSTETEKFIGYIPDDYSYGGKIDITIKNNKDKYIFIENKINAGDQPNQLIRYKNYKPDSILIYLTIYGVNPTEVSIGKDENIEYVKISYEKDILKWLELCKKESVDNPLLREILTQYIILVRQLTGQTRSKEMDKEILDIIIKDENNVSAAFNIILQDIYKIKLQILKNKFGPLMNKLGKKLSMDCDISFDGDDDCFADDWFFSFQKEEWKRYNIGFGVSKKYLTGFFYGLHDNDKDNLHGYAPDIPQELKEKLRSQNYMSSTDWPISIWMEDKYSNWDNKYFIELYTNENDISTAIENKINEILKIVEEEKILL